MDQIAAPKSKYRQPWPHSATGQFTLKIGFTLVKSSDGKFIGPSKNPKQWYFGLDPVEATAAAVAKQKEWEHVESGWPAVQQELADYVTIMGYSGCDEIVVMIDRERAGANEYGLLLLNQGGRPLWEHEVDECKKNAVAYAWNRACKSAERHL